MTIKKYASVRKMFSIWLYWQQHNFVIRLKIPELILWTVELDLYDDKTINRKVAKIEINVYIILSAHISVNLQDMILDSQQKQLDFSYNACPYFEDLHLNRKKKI